MGVTYPSDATFMPSVKAMQTRRGSPIRPWD